MFTPSSGAAEGDPDITASYNYTGDPVLDSLSDMSAGFIWNWTVTDGVTTINTLSTARISAATPVPSVTFPAYAPAAGKKWTVSLIATDTDTRYGISTAKTATYDVGVTNSTPSSPTLNDLDITWNGTAVPTTWDASHLTGTCTGVPLRTYVLAPDAVSLGGPKDIRVTWTIKKDGAGTNWGSYVTPTTGVVNTYNFIPDTVGTYVITLAVTDAAGVASTPAVDDSHDGGLRRSGSSNGAAYAYDEHCRIRPVRRRSNPVR